MRAPRHRFSDDVRSITRSMAGTMLEEGSVSQSPEELDEWIAERPGVKVALEKGGYTTAFSSHDLFPLLRAMTDRAAAPSSEPSRLRTASRPALLAGGALILAVVIGVIIGFLA